MKVLTVRLSDDLHAALKRRRVDTGVTINHMISRLIKLDLESWRESKFEIKQEKLAKQTLENAAESLCLEPAFTKRTPVLFTANPNKETR